MKNTLAIMLFILGALLIYSGYKGESFANTLRILTGQEPVKLEATQGNLGNKEQWDKNRDEWDGPVPDEQPKNDGGLRPKELNPNANKPT